MGTELAERGLLPDWVIRRNIRKLVGQRIPRRNLGASDVDLQQERVLHFAEKLRQCPIAISTAEARQQHEDLPVEFFQKILGPHLQSSCCYWPERVTTLEEAEKEMLRLTVRRADLLDGQSILDLGCGWGSLTLWMARRFPKSKILAVANSEAQRTFIESQTATRGIENVHAIAADLNDFTTGDRFDRVVSVETFVHVRNYERLLQRIASWLKSEGKLFLHVFAHREQPYPFEIDGWNDWVARHFFTGGIMPSEDLLYCFQRDMVLTDHWHLSGIHYQKTVEAWLKRLDAARREAITLLARSGGKRQYHRWRIFLMACSETFGFKQGSEWGVDHYLMERRRHRAH